MDRQQFNCSVCTTQYKGRQNGKELTEKKRSVQGCYSMSRIKYQLQNAIYESCIGHYTSKTVYELFNIAEHYGKGVMPFAGGSYEQPNKAIELLTMINNIKDEKIASKTKQRNGKEYRRS